MASMLKKIFLVGLIYILSISLVSSITTESQVCAVYFTGVGCPHCAKTDPVVLIDLLKEYPNLVIIEYEIYQQQQNAPILINYNSNYDSGLGIPLIIFDKNQHIVGDTPILQNVREIIEEVDSNGCPLMDGSSVDFNYLNISSLPANPKIWTKERILIPSEQIVDNELIRKLLTTDNLLDVLEETDYNTIKPKPIPLSGKTLNFDNAVEVDGCILQWNGEGIESNTSSQEENLITDKVEKVSGQKLTITGIISLALVDAINPCALAVLTLMLIAIISYNPKKRRNVLLAGLAFTTSVFIMYLFYGLVIIKFFQIVQALTSIRLMLYKILGIAAIILGLLNIKDFIRYKPGGIGSEMPMSLRPKVKKIISGITSPVGAFSVGAFVTVFLLPCTIGPYVIAGGILSALELIKTIPWLLIYNFIFVLPMIVITGIVYTGFKKVEDVSGWKDKNIRYLHLIAGLIILGLGIAMVFGWV